MNGEILAVYCRVSTEGQDDNYSIKVQKERGQTWGKRQGFRPEIISETYTGATLDRPKFRTLLDRIQLGEIKFLWVIEFTRLTRDTQDAINLYELFRENDVALYVNGERQHLSGPDNFLKFGIQSILSDYEKRRIRERFKRGADERRRKGGRWHSNLPYGFKESRDNKGQRVVTEEEGEAKIVRYIFKETLKGVPAKQIANTLTAFNIKEVRGKQFWDATVTRIIRNRLYSGEYIHEGEIVKSTVYPRLVTPEEWKDAQDILASRNRKYSTRYNYNQCSSLFRCHYCGNPMIFHDKKSPTLADPQNRRKQYKINHRKDCNREYRGKQNIYPKEYLDEFVDFLFTRFVFEKDSIIAYFQKEKERRVLWEENTLKEKHRLESSLKEVQRTKNNLLDILEKTGGDTDIQKRLVAATRKQKEIEGQIWNLNNEMGQSRKAIQSILDSLSANLMQEYFQEGKATPYHKRTVLHKYIESGVLKDREFHLRWITGQEVSFTIQDIEEYNEEKDILHSNWVKKFSYNSEILTHEEADSIMDNSSK